MTWERSEDLPLKPGPVADVDPPLNASAAEAAIDKAIPRSDDKAIPRSDDPLLKLDVRFEEYLSRLASLRRKCHSVRHRLEQWQELVRSHRETFDQMVRRAEIPGDLPANAQMCLRLSAADTRLDSELEALIGAARSGLDILARVVAAFIPGASQMHRYTKVQGKLEKEHPGHPAEVLMSEARRAWVDEVRERRDSTVHYVALSAASTIEVHGTSTREISRTHVVVGIPHVPTKESPSIWWDPASVLLGGAAHRSMTVDIPGKERLEAHGIFDRSGRLILRHNGPPPPRPDVIDGDQYACELAQRFEAHVAALLDAVRTTPFPF